MFSKLVTRNSWRARKDNALLFSSMVIAVVTFYIVLSLENLDILPFLKESQPFWTSDLIKAVPIFYGFTLVLLFFMLFYASKIEMERRSHEFGLYLILGMRRGALFKMLVLEDLKNAAQALALGLPLAILISEVISLVTSRLLGLGVGGHRFSLSGKAILFTVLDFVLIKGLASLILSGYVVSQEIGDLMARAPKDLKTLRSKKVDLLALVLGTIFLGLGYHWAFTGQAWKGTGPLVRTLSFGILGTFLVFYGLRLAIDGLMALSRENRLHVFNVRQVQAAVVQKSTSLAVCSLFILAGLCFFGAGVTFYSFQKKATDPPVDYTFSSSGMRLDKVQNVLAAQGLEDHFQDLFEVRLGFADEALDLKMDELLSFLGALPASEARDQVLENLQDEVICLISLSGYNRILDHAGRSKLFLEDDQVGLYLGDGSSRTSALVNRALDNSIHLILKGQPHRLVGPVQTSQLDVDRSAYHLCGLILPDSAFEAYTKDQAYAQIDGVHVNGVLNPDLVADKGLVLLASEVNEKLDQIGFPYESILTPLGRQLFHIIAAGYLNLYLAIIFMVIANTIIGVHFLMEQERSRHSFQTLVHLGASYESLCQSSDQQIHWYFGLPIAMAGVGAVVGIRSLMIGLMPAPFMGDVDNQVMVAAATLLVLLLVELFYMTLVKRMSRRRIAAWMAPRRLE